MQLSVRQSVEMCGIVMDQPEIEGPSKAKARRRCFLCQRSDDNACHTWALLLQLGSFANGRYSSLPFSRWSRCHLFFYEKQSIPCLLTTFPCETQLHCQRDVRRLTLLLLLTMMMTTMMLLQQSSGRAVQISCDDTDDSTTAHHAPCTGPAPGFSCMKLRQFTEFAFAMPKLHFSPVGSKRKIRTGA